MQTLTGRDDKGKDYYFAYIEKFKKIIVWVDGQQKYIIEVVNNGLTCDCPGARYHGHCRHVGFVTNEFNFNRVNKETLPIRMIAEEYYSDWLKKTNTKKSI